MEDSENIISQLKNSVEVIIKKHGTTSKFAKEIVEKIQSLQTKLQTLSDEEQKQFLNEMKASFQQTIGKVEQKLTHHQTFANVYNSSIVMAFVMLGVVVLGWLSSI